MKDSIIILARRILVAAALVFVSAFAVHGEPKRVLVVTAVQGYPHTSRFLAEKVIAGLGEQSGLFTCDYVRGGADGKSDEDVKEKMSREALKKYDAIIFANTTGDLPLPEKDALIDFVKAGKGFVGTHSASDTFHGWRPYLEMLGGEFQIHHEQVRVECLNQDPQ